MDDIYKSGEQELVAEAGGVCQTIVSQKRAKQAKLEV